MRAETLFITTVAMPMTVRSGLDTMKAKRAKASGKRPTTRQLVVEALEVFLKRNRIAVAGA